MKLAIVADLHLGSKDIGDGRWKQRALQDVLIPELRRHEVTHIIFAGDTLDFQGLSSLSADRPDLLRFTVDQLATTSAQMFLLMGNHDDRESCRFFEHMGGPRIVQDDWVPLDISTGAYLMAPRQDKLVARSAIEQLNVSLFRSRILVLHEDLDVFHDGGFLAAACEKFHLVVNGHNHVFRPVRDQVYLLPACLPWKVRLGSQCDLAVSRLADGTIKVEETDQTPWGFVVVESDLRPQFVPVDSSVSVVTCEIKTNPDEVEPAIRQVLDHLWTRGKAQEMAVHVYVAPRIDSNLESAIRRAYAGQFLDLRLLPLQGPGAVVSGVRDRLPTEEAALKYIEIQHGEWARALIEKLEEFFQLRNPRHQKEKILEIVKSSLPEGLNHG